MAETMTAAAQLVRGMQFEATAGSGHCVTLDASEEHGGTNLGFQPMELLAVGLAGCTAMDVIAILRKKRQVVTNYEVRVQATRAEQQPMVFTEIAVEHLVTGQHVDPEAVRRAIELAETRYCSAGAMLAKIATITHTFRIFEDDAPAAVPGDLESLAGVRCPPHASQAVGSASAVTVA
jgi:putative redox protein